MVKPVGGRGCKAPYATVVVRIPVDIKPQVDALVSRFRDGTDCGFDKSADLLQLIDKYKSQSKSTRDWSKANKFIDELSLLLDIK